MAYNEEIESRIKKIVSRWQNTDAKKMFGGVGYLLNGNMCFGIHKESLILRTTKERAEELIKNEYISIFDITGRPMKGWVMISPDILETENQLRNMLEIGKDFAATLPKK